MPAQIYSHPKGCRQTGPKIAAAPINLCDHFSGVFNGVTSCAFLRNPNAYTRQN
jgi:hypothetical protein